MPKIHGIAYLIIGLFVSAVSWRFNYEKLIVFFYAGLAFIFVGIAKLALGFVKNKDKNANKMHQKAHSQMQHKYCSKCGAALSVHNRFCGRCGAKV